MLLKILVLFILAGAIQAPPNDTRKRKCKIEATECGDYPKPLVGEFVGCKMDLKRCLLKCELSCPNVTKPDGKSEKMVMHQPKNKVETFKCKGKGKKEWVPTETPTTFCKAKIVNKEVKQNFKNFAIDQMNQLASSLLESSYSYLGMVTFFQRTDVALPGFAKLTSDLSAAESKHARDVISYVTQRGGFITLLDVPRPVSHERLLVAAHRRPALAGVDIALEHARMGSQTALDLIKKAIDNEDPNMKHFLEDGLLSDKIELIKKLADIRERLVRLPDEDYDLGQYVIDTELLG